MNSKNKIKIIHLLKLTLKIVIKIKKLKIFFSIIKNFINYILTANTRNIVEKELKELKNSYKKVINKKPFKKCLIDATFDSPNYWFRYAILRSALNEPYFEYAIMSKFNKYKIKNTLKNFGIKKIFFIGLTKKIEEKYIISAKNIISKLSIPDDLLRIKLPYDAPAEDLYDSLLKFQRKGSLNVKDKFLTKHIAQYLKDLDISNNIIDSLKPDLAILSHTASGRVNNGALTWHLTRKGIPIIVPHGSFGHFSHYKIFSYEDHFDHVNKPSSMDLLEKGSRTEKLKKLGAEYIKRRLSGEAKDLAAELAFSQNTLRINKQKLCSSYKWDSQKPIVGVFSSVWFDNPHTLGMKQFIDFNEWLMFTYNAACENKKINWIFKPHPAEEWYGGAKMKDLFPENLPNHIKIADREWNGEDFRNLLDAAVTLHGTTGIEMTSTGKPVLVATKGWYGDLGFVVLKDTKESYKAALKSLWWIEEDKKKNKELSDIFAGYYFCVPKEENSVFLPNDSDQTKLFKIHADLLKNHRNLIESEIKMMRKWIYSDLNHYHVFKMKNAKDYKFSKNI
ncbi:MAG: hypothetical protein CBB97_15085 [Candidatus Endolissoclinum sp. TMED37]|nr:MAG: hypothetical protein CBB97_15085 [Candidatus Endolissoclinum sp. TMED37]